MATTLEDTLKEIQILLGKPKRKLAGALKYYINFLNIREDEEKTATSPTGREKMRMIRHKKITWADFVNPTRKEISQLAQKYPFHPLHLEDCVSKGQFPKIEQSDEDHYIFLLLRFPRYKEIEEKIVISQICFFLGKDYLVTIHEDSQDAIASIFKDCAQNPKQKEAYIDGSSAHLLYTIIDQLTKDFYPLLQKILKEVDQTEDIVFDDKVSGVYQVSQLRQKIVTLRRVISPLRTLLSDMENRVKKFTSINLSVYFDNIIHRVEKAWETLEEARETVEIYKDSDFTFSTEKTNRILAILTIIFTFTIPASVIGTLYGMNIVLPGGIGLGEWTFWGKYTTFIVILIVAAIPALLMQWYFRKRGWL